jgi:hypothetical protein
VALPEGEVVQGSPNPVFLHGSQKEPPLSGEPKLEKKTLLSGQAGAQPAVKVLEDPGIAGAPPAAREKKDGEI